MILQLPQPGNVGGHLHHLGNLAVDVPDGGCPGQHIILFAGFRGDDLFGGGGYFDFKSRSHRAVLAGGSPVFVNFVAIGTDFIAKIAFEKPVGGR